MKKVLFLTKCRFPFGDASSKRYMVFSRFFKDRGFKPIFIGMGQTTYKKEEIIDDNVVVSIRKYKNPNLIQKILNHLKVDLRIVKFAAKYYSDVDIIILDPRLHKAFKRFKQHFSCTNIIYSVVEYYSPSEYPFNGFFSKAYKENVAFNNSIESKDGKIIAISSYLEDFFKSKGLTVVRIPFVIDNQVDTLENTISKKIKDKNKIYFVYCGNPRNKDKLSDILLAFCLLESSLLSKTRVDIYGVDKKWLKRQKQLRPHIKTIDSFCFFHGFVAFNKIAEHYSISDFSLLLRPENKRYTKAGFPTKISESLEYGIPPITNFTSDLSDYLVDMENCLKVSGDNYLAFRDTLIKVFSIKEETIEQMKINSKKTSVEKLDVRCFYNELDYICGK